MVFLKQSTSIVVQFGPFVDVADAVTLETGLASAMDNATTGLRLSKNGVAFADRNDATVPVYDAMGCYRVTLNATDTDTLGVLRVIFEEAATCLPVWEDYMVMPANAYEAMFGSAELIVKLGDVAHGGTAATLTLKSIAVDNNAGTAVDIKSTGSNGKGINVAGNGSGEGMKILGGDIAAAALLALAAGSNGTGIHAGGSGVGFGITGAGGVNGTGVKCVGGTATGNGIVIASQSASSDISGSNLFARFADGLRSMPPKGAVQVSPTPTTTVCGTDLALVNVDQLVGRVILFLDNNNQYVQSVIRASTTGGLLTYDVIPVAPASGDTLVVV